MIKIVLNEEYSEEKKNKLLIKYGFVGTASVIYSINKNKRDALVTIAKKDTVCCLLYRKLEKEVNGLCRSSVLRSIKKELYTRMIELTHKK